MKVQQKLTNIVVKNRLLIVSLTIFFIVFMPYLSRGWQFTLEKISAYPEVLRQNKIDKESKKWDGILNEYKITSLEHRSDIYQGRVFTVVTIKPEILQYLEYLRNMATCKSIKEKPTKQLYNPQTHTFNIDWNQYKPTSQGGDPLPPNSLPPSYCSYDIYVQDFSRFFEEIDSIEKLATDKNLSEIKQVLKQNNNFSDYMPTKIINFTPTSYLQTERVDGKCWQSIASTSDNAYRCIDINHAIHDPCFEFQKGKMACYRDPDELAATVISTVGEIENTDNRIHDADRLPWVSILENGTRCYVMTGTGVPINSVTYHLNCVDTEIKDLYGEINKETMPWQMKLIDYTGSSHDMYVNIIKVYK